MTWSLEGAYDAYPQIEEEFSAALDESLSPRDPGMLLDLVAEFRLAPGSVALDVGCGEGRHSRALATRFGFAVTGIDPVPRHVETARATASATGAIFTLGTAEDLPASDASADLIWCRDVLVHVADLGRAYAEFRRVLRPGGRAVIYQMFGTEMLEAREADWLWSTMGVMPASADVGQAEAAMTASGLDIDQCIDLSSEWGEWAEEHHGGPNRKLLHAARLLRDPARFAGRYGRDAYDMMLGDCLWHVYAMIGKLTRRVYVLSSPGF